MKARFTESEIIGVFKEAEAGGKIDDLYRQHGVSDATYYNWKAKFGGDRLGCAAPGSSPGRGASIKKSPAFTGWTFCI